MSSDQEVEDFIAESAIMLRFHHQNVLSLVGVSFDTEDQLPIILLPFMDNGDLRAFLKSKRRLRQSSDEFPKVQLFLRSLAVLAQINHIEIGRSH